MNYNLHLNSLIIYREYCLKLNIVNIIIIGHVKLINILLAKIPGPPNLRYFSKAEVLRTISLIYS